MDTPNISKNDHAPPNWNIANQVTLVRILVSIVLFVCLHFRLYGISTILFILGAGTDWIDGYLARRRNLVTQLGRILDPLADKIIICGTFIFLAAVPDSKIAAWIAVVVVGRELIVTVIRSFLEASGQDFSAKMAGKIKMVLQCAAAISSLILLWYVNGANAGATPPWLPTAVWWLAIAMAVSTIHSGVLYVIAAGRLLREIPSA